MDLFQRTPLFYAAMNGSARDIYHFCTVDGINPNYVDILGFSPLQYVLQCVGDQTQCYEAADCLLQCGANPNCHKEGDLTPLMLATIRHNGPLIQRLIGAGADINARYMKQDSHMIPYRSTAISLAIQLNYKPIATQLLQYVHSPEIIQEVILLSSTIVTATHMDLQQKNRQYQQHQKNQTEKSVTVIGSDEDA